MKLCFFHQSFDADVSSGTDHARHQWHELAMGYGITELAVINQTDQSFGSVNHSLPVSQYRTLEDFVDMHLKLKNMVFIEQGDHKPCQLFPFKKHHWIVIGGTQGLPSGLNVHYARCGSDTALYPREAAAIALDCATWQLSL